MHAFITHMRAKPGKRDEVIALTTVMLEKTRTEEGIPVYVFATDAESPDDFWFYDVYESEEARKAHESSAEFARTMPALMEVAELVSVRKLAPYGPMKITPPPAEKG
jgi:quinol monooxygenase YgiN